MGVYFESESERECESSLYPQLQKILHFVSMPGMLFLMKFFISSLVYKRYNIPSVLIS